MGLYSTKIRPRHKGGTGEPPRGIITDTNSKKWKIGFSQERNRNAGEGEGEGACRMPKEGAGDGV